MEAVNIYDEKIFLKRTFFTVAMSIFLFVILLLLLFKGPITGLIGVLPAFLLFFCIAILFSYQTTKITPHTVTIGWHWMAFKRTIPLEDIEGCSIGESPPSYTSMGTYRLGEFRGKECMEISAWGLPRIVLHLRGKRDIVFATKKPEEITKILNEYLQK
jgi:hypothetical protein